MKLLGLFFSIFLFAACQQYPEQTLNDIGGKPGACQQYKYVSNISIQIATQSDMPANLSGSVNDGLVIDECAFGNNTSSYSIVKNGPRLVTIGIWVDNAPSLNRQLFDKQGKPVDNTFVHLTLRGRARCGDREASVAEVHRILNWKPVYASGKECGISGYTAVVQ